MPRLSCFTCFKPQQFCICNDITQVKNITGVYIIQHPRERSHPFGTVRIARQGLQHCQVFICGPDEPHLKTLRQKLPDDIALLFPGEHARHLEELCAPNSKIITNSTAGHHPSTNPPPMRSQNPPKNLLILDGTWSHASRLYRSTPWIQQLPHVAISPPKESGYRIRKEPKLGFVSTIEAIVYALQLLEPQTVGLMGLLDSFTRLIDKQIAHTDTFPKEERLKTRLHTPKPLPIPQSIDHKSAVLIFCEMLTGKHQGNPQYKESIRVTAKRLWTGECFDQWVTPHQLTLRESDLIHMGAPDNVLQQALSYAEVCTLWNAFIKEDDQLVTWSRTNLDKFPNGEHWPGEQMALKEIYCNLEKRPSGHLRDVVGRHALTVAPDQPIGGRAGENLAWMESVRLYLGQRRQDDPLQT